MPSSSSRRLREQRLLGVRVERAVGLDLGEALLRERVGERRGARGGRRPRAAPPRARAAASSARSRSSSTGSELLHEPLARRARPVAPGRARPACGSCRTRPSAAGARRGTRRAPASPAASSIDLLGRLLARLRLGSSMLRLVGHGSSRPPPRRPPRSRRPRPPRRPDARPSPLPPPAGACADACA